MRGWAKKKLFFFCGGGLMAAAACTPSFQSASDVNDLRVLAVEAEPPEAQFDQQGSGSGLTVSNVDDVHLRVLAVDPSRPGSFTTLLGSLCAPTDSRRCDNRGPQSDPIRIVRHGGDEFATDVPGLLMTPVIRFAQSDDKLKGLGGIRVQFSFSVDDNDPHGSVYADKLLLYSQRGTPPNHNPTLTGLSLTQTGVFLKTVAPGETLQLPVGTLFGVRPILAADARETYTTTDLQGHTVTLTEDPTYAFFTTPGAEFDRDTAFEPIDGVAPPDGLTRLDAFNRGSGTIWVVVRDGRGGESWVSFPWTSD
jgi:hypothetical protein